MKILLLNAPTEVKDFSYVFPLSLNLVYLGDALLRNGFEVKIKDLSFEKDWDNIARFIKREKPGIVGISCFSDNRMEAYRLIRLVKEIDMNIKVIAGGHFFSAMPFICLKHFDIDAIVIGEGERTIVNLANTLKKGLKLKSVRGIAYKEDGKIVYTGHERLIKNLDEIPVPDFKSLINKNELNLSVNKNKLVPLLSMRGCIFRCSYCYTSWFNQHSMRVFSPKRVVEELESLKRFTGNRKLIFWDPILTYNKARIKKLCDLIKQKLDIDLWGQTRPEFVSKDICECLKKAGFIELYFGVESVSPNVLSKANRNIRLQKTVKAFELCKSAGISTRAGFIIGLESDYLTNVKSTLSFIRRINPDSLKVSFATLYPGTALYRLARAKGLISDNFWVYGKTSAYYTGALSIKEMILCRFLIEFNYNIKKGNSLRYLRDQFKNLLYPPVPRSYLNVDVLTKIFQKN